MAFAGVLAPVDDGGGGDMVFLVGAVDVGAGAEVLVVVGVLDVAVADVVVGASDPVSAEVPQSASTSAPATSTGGSRRMIVMRLTDGLPTSTSSPRPQPHDRAIGPREDAGANSSRLRIRMSDVARPREHARRVGRQSL